MIRPLSFALAALLPTTAFAEYISADGHQYDLTCNADGFVLTSQAPVSRWSGTGATTQVTTETEVIYLGTSCDASHAVFGTGEWSWANGGFVAMFPNYRIGFPRQELQCDTPLPTCDG